MRLPGNLHATALVVAGRGILVRGASGSGKSALALSLLRRAEAAGLEAFLVGDDQIFVRAEGGQLVAEAPASIAGMIEVRGVGILRETFEQIARLDLVVDLRERDELERLPAPGSIEIAGIRLRRICLPARDPAFAADIVLSILKDTEFLPPGASPP